MEFNSRFNGRFYLPTVAVFELRHCRSRANSWIHGTLVTAFVPRFDEESTSALSTLRTGGCALFRFI